MLTHSFAVGEKSDIQVLLYSAFYLSIYIVGHISRVCLHMDCDSVI